MYTSDRRLYLTPAGEVSEEPVSGGSLLVPKGGELSNADAERYGLTSSPAMDEEGAGPEEEAEEAEPVDEKEATPRTNKARKGGEDKGG